MDGKKTNNIFIPTARTSNYGKGPRIWNALPNIIKNMTSLHAFLTNMVDLIYIHIFYFLIAQNLLKNLFFLLNCLMIIIVMQN